MKNGKFMFILHFSFITVYTRS